MGIENISELKPKSDNMNKSCINFKRIQNGVDDVIDSKKCKHVNNNTALCNKKYRVAIIKFRKRILETIKENTEDSRCENVEERYIKPIVIDDKNIDVNKKNDIRRQILENIKINKENNRLKKIEMNKNAFSNTRNKEYDIRSQVIKNIRDNKDNRNLKNKENQEKAKYMSDDKKRIDIRKQIIDNIRRNKLAEENRKKLISNMKNNISCNMNTMKSTNKYTTFRISGDISGRYIR